jgi:hypothetical protein
MSVILNSIGLRGMQGYIVKVEVKVINGLNSFTIVGLPDLSVKEAKQRVMATLLSIENANLLEKKSSSTCHHPSKRKMVHFSPGHRHRNCPRTEPLSSAANSAKHRLPWRTFIRRLRSTD